MNRSEDIVRQYGQSVFTIICQLVGNVQDAEELTQDALLRGLSQMDSYDPAKASLRTWLCRIAYRTALNHLRRPVLQTLTMDDEAVSAAAEAEMQTLFQQPDDERAELLERAIDHLTADEQTLVTLFYYDDLPLADIGSSSINSSNKSRTYETGQHQRHRAAALPRREPAPRHTTPTATGAPVAR